MATVEYDLDTSGGLMEQIQKLVAPPVSDEVLRRQRRREREYRRPGRAVNHDCCDSCKEGGDLLCCDWCPAAFHLQCHDPPLEEDDVPPGEWKCHKCKVSPPKPEKDDDASSTKSGSSTGAPVSRGTKSRPAPRPPTPQAPTPQPMETDAPPETETEDPLLENLTPLQKLARAARMMNPVQFDLPKDISCTTFLPGSSKRKWWGKDRNSNKKMAYEMDNFMVPLPAKLCFSCNKSCRVGPLIQCDYCPLLYHMDCLDPPLTSLPTNRWMCPNHPEIAVDQMLLKSLSLTERVKLWDKFNSRVNQHTVKVNFVNKVHRESPPFRIKIQHPMRKTIAIPEAIKLHYANPPPMLPGVPSVVRQGDGEGQGVETTPEEQEEWLTAVVALQTSIAKHLTQQQMRRSSTESDIRTECVKPEKPTASVQPVIQGTDQSMDTSSDKHLDLDQTSLSSQDHLGNGPLDLGKGGAVSLLHTNSSGLSQMSINGEMDSAELGKSKPDSVVTRSRQDSGDSAHSSMTRVNWASSNDKALPNSSSGTPNKNIVISAINKVNNTVVTKVLSQAQGGKILTTNLSGKNASILTSRASGQGSVKVSSVTGKQIVPGTANNAKVISLSTNQSGVKSGPSSSTSSNTPTSSNSKPSLAGSNPNTIVSLNASLQQCLDGTGDKELSKLDEKLIQILAWQRLQQLLPSKQNTPSSPTRKGAANGLINQDISEVKARAVLCPLTSKGQPISMSYRTLSIGTGADMDVCLSQFGHCNFTSPKHAHIFYDETTKHYELLNYSEHGTTVDNVLYSCDFSDKPATTPQPTPVVAAVRGIIKAKQEEKQQEEESKLTMSAKAHVNKKPCNCKASSSTLIGGSGAGWEGTALLHHGSYIKVGCLQFVFSIVDHATVPLGQEKKREPMSLLKSTLRGTELDVMK